MSAFRAPTASANDGATRIAASAFRVDGRWEVDASETKRSPVITEVGAPGSPGTAPEEQVRTIVVMGVSGAGKTTVGRMLAGRLAFDFRDADDLHPRHNVERMATGHPLVDEDRWPWLDAVGHYLTEQRALDRGAVMACSALKRSYRDVLRGHVADAFFVFLDGPMAIVHERIYGRNHEFMPPSLLASQYQSLEPLADDEWGLRIDIEELPEQIVENVCLALTDAPTPAALRDS